jgi:N-carbamoylputrescine amidase
LITAAAALMMAVMQVKVGAVQMIAADGDHEANISKALFFCDAAAARGVQILCFPECATTGFDWVGRTDGAATVHAETVPGPTVERFARKAAERGIYIVVGMVERPAGSSELFNTAFLVGPTEGYMGRQRKVLAEPVFSRGTEATPFTTKYGKIGIFVCADMRSPELARLLALRGARLFLQPTAYFHPDAKDGADARRRYEGKRASQRARAMENGVHLVSANIGRTEYVNNTHISGPAAQGPETILARATRREQLVVADLDLDAASSSAAAALARAPWLLKELAEESQPLHQPH